MYILVVGNPVDGLQFIGPFETKPEAFRNHPSSGDWWIAELKATEKLSNFVPEGRPNLPELEDLLYKGNTQ